MATYSFTFLNRQIHAIYNGSTEQVIEELRRHIKNGLIDPSQYNQVNIQYSLSGPIPSADTQNPKFYPVKFTSQDKKEQVWISCVTTGYMGEGPRGTLNALKLMGFEPSPLVENAIFSDKEANYVLKK